MKAKIELNRIGCRMDDEGIEANTVHAADPVGMDRKSCLYTTLRPILYCLIFFG